MGATIMLGLLGAIFGLGVVGVIISTFNQLKRHQNRYNKPVKNQVSEQDAIGCEFTADGGNYSNLNQ